ncbi:hypothetical protein Ga0074812_106325 [Parafrankia irregularis]|uniref:DUF35 domain-containing protein n=1 Tax=Parafrankia irregularis TaxID=795642 RepID=A0A0S4QNI7_9ACTN|nr:MULTISPECIES: OB-fold domain-containing protein [Parafrankia]MBE3202317.1 OB-fold domain-containing protein [Parafrankia sp. CH37]CUU56070.1 hypothetical protein Ga0074812_106325 [Parafrankia irregularis]
MARLLESKVEFPYRRSLGPVVGAYVAALGQRRLTGVRAGGRVLVPPLEYDPETGEASDPTPVDVGPAGTVRTWTWVPEPTRAHPFDHPFAFALIQLDGADTALFHAVDAGDPAAMTTGLRVVPRWRDTPRGHLDDLVCFVPGGSAEPPEAAAPAEAAEPEPASEQEPAPALEPVSVVEIPSSLRYVERLAPAGSRYADSLLAGVLMGQRCTRCGLVYVPPRDFCPIDAVPLGPDDDVVLPDRGVVTNFTIVTPVPYPGQRETEPFARVSVLLDEADALLGLQAVVDVDNADVRVGMRVAAAWLPPEERDTSALTNRGWGAVDGVIEGWRPTGEPDVAVADAIERVF